MAQNYQTVTSPVSVNEATIVMQVDDIAKLAYGIESLAADIKYRITGESEPKDDGPAPPPPAAIASKVARISEVLYRAEHHINRINQKIGG